MKATWNGATLADSDDTIVVEDNHYFPAESIHAEYFADSDTHTICPWKGEASYRTIKVDGQSNPDAAWFYPEPGPIATPTTVPATSARPKAVKLLHTIPCTIAEPSASTVRLPETMPYSLSSRFAGTVTSPVTMPYRQRSSSRTTSPSIVLYSLIIVADLTYTFGGNSGPALQNLQAFTVLQERIVPDWVDARVLPVEHQASWGVR
jgi:hypothetical protein